MMRELLLSSTLCLSLVGCENVKSVDQIPHETASKIFQPERNNGQEAGPALLKVRSVAEQQGGEMTSAGLSFNWSSVDGTRFGCADLYSPGSRYLRIMADLREANQYGIPVRANVRGMTAEDCLSIDDVTLSRE